MLPAHRYASPIGCVNFIIYNIKLKLEICLFVCLSVCLSVVCIVCIVARRCVLLKNCLKKQYIGNGL